MWWAKADVPMNQDVTQLLGRVEAGDAQAMDRLLAAIYEDLRRIARARLRGESHHTLGTTALVHEGWLAMHGGVERPFADRRKYFAYASKAMRHVLVDRARQRAAGKRQAPDPDDVLQFQGDTVDLLALDQALERLSEQNGDLADLVELRLFMGMSSAEVAELQEVTTRTVERNWAKARALLSAWLDEGQ